MSLYQITSKVPPISYFQVWSKILMSSNCVPMDRDYKDYPFITAHLEVEEILLHSIGRIGR